MLGLCYTFVCGCVYIHSLFRTEYYFSKIILPQETQSQKSGRELTTAEVIAVFTIAFSTLYILLFTEVGRLLHNITLIIPIGIIALAVRLLYFSKESAALQTSKLATN
jgi:hypothetical protein